MKLPYILKKNVVTPPTGEAHFFMAKEDNKLYIKQANGSLIEVSKVGEGGGSSPGNGGGSGNTAPITIGWDGQGGFITTGLTRYFVAPYDATITGWSIVATGTSPTCTIDVWKIASGTALPTVANTITAAAIPALSTGNVIRSSTLTGWTTDIIAGDILAFNINAAANALTIKINLELQ